MTRMNNSGFDCLNCCRMNTRLITIGDLELENVRRWNGKIAAECTLPEIGSRHSGNVEQLSNASPDYDAQTCRDQEYGRERNHEQAIYTGSRCHGQTMRSSAPAAGCSIIVIILMAGHLG